MFITVNGRKQKLRVPDAVRIGEDSVQRMVQELVNEVQLKYFQLTEDDYNKDGEYFDTYITATGDVCIIARLEVNREWDSAVIEVEVCKPERSAIISLKD